MPFREGKDGLKIPLLRLEEIFLRVQDSLIYRPVPRADDRLPGYIPLFVPAVLLAWAALLPMQAFAARRRHCRAVQPDPAPASFVDFLSGKLYSPALTADDSAVRRLVVVCFLSAALLRCYGIQRPAPGRDRLF